MPTKREIVVSKAKEQERIQERKLEQGRKEIVETAVKILEYLATESDKMFSWREIKRKFHVSTGLDYLMYVEILNRLEKMGLITRIYLPEEKKNTLKVLSR